jgi:hypothetical protein
MSVPVELFPLGSHAWRLGDAFRAAAWYNRLQGVSRMSTKTLMTAEEFAQTGSETDGFELVRGELLPMPPPRRKHGVVCLNTAFLLKAYTINSAMARCLPMTPAL